MSLAVALGLALGSSTASALEPDRRLTQYAHETWERRTGAPFVTPWTVCQTTDGYLWLGTEADGLLRFDGVRFVREPAPDRVLGRVYPINRILAARGALWIGTPKGLVRYADGAASLVAGGIDVKNLALTGSGDLLVAVGGLAGMSLEELLAVDLAHASGALRLRGDGTLGPLRPDSSGDFLLAAGPGDEAWVATASGTSIVRLAGGQTRAVQAIDDIANGGTAPAHVGADGTLWVATRRGVVAVRDGRIVRRITAADGLPSDDVSAVFEDQHGSLWVGTATGGIARLRGGRVERLDRRHGLPGGQVRSFFEDREGSLWIVTQSALFRLYATDVLPWGEPEGLGYDVVSSLLEGRDGSIWIWSDGGGLNRIRDGEVRVFTTRDGLASNLGGPLYESRDGAIWIGHDRGVSRFENGRITAYTEGAIGRGYVPVLTEDAKGMLAHVLGMGLARLEHGRVRPYARTDAVTDEPMWMPFSVRRLRDGTLWLATAAGAWSLRDGVLRKAWSVPRGRPMVACIHEDSQGALWFGTWEVLYRVAGASVTAYTTEQGLPHDRVAAVLEDRTGHLWIGTPRGISRVARKELEEIASGRRTRADVETFDTSDGMRVADVSIAAQPNACLARDGRLWFATRAGAVSIDPARLGPPRTPPARVESVEADGSPLGSSDVALPAGARRVEIAFTAMTLLAPQRVRFRYKLEGFDRDWIDSEGERVATYTNLPPGRYRFQVSAAHRRGPWGAEGATIAIRQLPRFYETAWFLGACALAVAGSSFTLHRYRLVRHLRHERELELRVQEALAQVRTLSGLLPICSWCKKVRDDDGYWSKIETYISQRSSAEFTHGICPECAAQMRAERNALT